MLLDTTLVAAVMVRRAAAAAPPWGSMSAAERRAPRSRRPAAASRPDRACRICRVATLGMPVLRVPCCACHAVPRWPQVLAWEWSLLSAGAFWLFFTFVTGAFFSSTLEKVPKGAWFR